MSTFIATAYGPPWNAMEGSGVTSTGVNLQSGRQLPVVAVDPRVIPYGSIIRIDNSPLGRNKLFVAADTGGAIKGNRIDFFVASGRSAQNGWGRRPINVSIVQRGSGPGSVQGALSRVGQTGGGSAPGRRGVPQVPGLQGPLTNIKTGGFMNLPITSFNQAAFEKDQHKYVLGQFLRNQGSSSPWDQGTPKIPGLDNLPNPLLGILPSTQPNPSDYETTQTLKVAQSALQQIAGPGRQLKVHPGALKGYKGYVNPIPGFAVGRTDEGVDASTHPGAPIRAIGDSRVIGFSPNWYAGQPYMLLQLLNGPKAGKYYYVAEQISPRVHSGQVVHAGDVIATYASHGTAIEIGWGTGTPGRAAASGHYTEGVPTPEGNDFRRFLAGLGAR